MKFKWWSRIGAIFLTYWGLETGYTHCRDAVRDSIELNGMYVFDIYTSIFLSALFLIWFLPYFLPSVPLWYHGFKK